MNSNNICEKIAIAILSDEELSAEYKEHIENCRECQELLSQAKKMKKELSSLSVPGLEEGQITMSVMESIKKEKTSIPFPKFKITHHLGTAAAVAIILVAALMIKNPSEMDVSQNDNAEKAPVIYNVKQNNHTLSAVNDEETAEEEILYRLSSDISDEISAENITNDAVLFVDTSDVYTPESQEETNDTIYNANDNVSSNIARSSEPIAEDGAFTDEAPMMLSAVLDEDEPIDDTQVSEYTEFASADIGGGGGGSGGGCSRPVQEENPPKLMMKKPQTSGSSVEEAEAKVEVEAEAENDASVYLFEGIKFSLIDEDFDENIILVNERLRELYGDEYVVSYEKLEALGVGNMTFVEIVKNMTKEDFEFYKSSYDIFK